MAIYVNGNKVCITKKVTSQGIGIPREISPTGVYQSPSKSFTFRLPNNTTTLETFSLLASFYNCTGLTSVDLSNLVTIRGQESMSDAFYGCTKLTSVNLSSLTTISGSSSMYRAFYGCTKLATIDLSNLTTVYGNRCMYRAFYNCTSLKTLSFPSLTSNSFGSYTNQFNGMLSGVTGCTVHFPSNLQSVIGSWPDVTSGFGGTNTAVLFDLPATT